MDVENGRVNRLEELAKRARSLRAELDRRVRGDMQATGSYFDRAGLSEVAAANLELIDAADPLRSGVLPDFLAERTMKSALEAASTAAPESRTTSMDVVRRSEGAAEPHGKRMYLILEAVELAPGFAASMAEQVHLILRCSVPRLENGQVTQDVVLASCEKGRPGSSRSMLHCGHSSQHFANLTLAEHPVLHLLASHEPDCPKTQDLESLVTVAAGELPWPKWEEAMRHGPIRVPLLSALAHEYQEDPVVGCVLVTIRNAEHSPEGLLDTRPAYLKVWLEDLRLPQSLHGVYIVAKLGRDQEIVAHLAKEGQRVEGDEVVATVALSALAEEPCWRLDANRQILVSGPVPEKLFFQVWRGQELLGLAGLPVPVLTKNDMAGLCIPGRPSVEVASCHLKVTATGSGETCGVIRVKLYAEMVSRQPPGMDAISAPREELVRETAVIELPARTCVEMTAPISNREVATWFGHLFCQTVASALQISPARIHILSVDGSSLMFEISAGPADEVTPSSAAKEFSRQICTAESPLANSDLAPFLMALPRHTAKAPPQDLGAPTMPLQSRILGATREQQTSYGPPIHGPKPPANDGLEEMVFAVLERLFEVVFASGVDPELAFSVLDRDCDGMVAVGDVVALLHHLGLPLPQDVLGLPSQAGLNEVEFRRQFFLWLQSRQQQPPVPPVFPSWEELLLPTGAAGDRCLLLPDFLLFAMLDPDGAGHLKPEIWHAFALRCLGLGQEAASATYSFCDQHGLGAVSYRDFRRYIARVNDLRVQRVPEAAAQLDAICQDVRAVLELVELPVVQEPGRLAAVSDALGRRGYGLDTTVTLSGFQELLCDLRLPPHVAGPLLRWQESISVALRSCKGQVEPPPLTYRTLLAMLRASRALVQTHLDGLCGACMLSGIDLKLVLDFALRRPTQALSAEELAGALMAAGVDLKAVDPKDVLLALDPHGCKQIFVPDLIQVHEKFLAKFEGLLSTMASCIGGRQLSPDQLFPDTRLASFVSLRRASCR